MPSYGEYQQPAGKMLSCGCMSGCECKTKEYTSIENMLPYKGNQFLRSEMIGIDDLKLYYKCIFIALAS